MKSCCDRAGCKHLASVWFIWTNPWMISMNFNQSLNWIKHKSEAELPKINRYRRNCCVHEQQRKTLVNPDLHWRKVSRWLWIFHADTHTWSAAGSRWRKDGDGAAHARAVRLGELGSRAWGGRLVSEVVLKKVCLTVWVQERPNGTVSVDHT